MAKIGKLAVALVALLVLIAVVNIVSVERWAWEVRKASPGNREIEAWAYHRLGVIPGEIVFDLYGISNDSSAADVTRVLLQFAERLKERRLDRVYLARRRAFHAEG